MKIIEKIESIDWDFENYRTNYATHDLHPYPAKFIPQIPSSLIKILTKEAETVYDPFCGCGTTLVEALLMNRRAIGNDVNPLAILISSAKLTHLTDKQITLVECTLSDIETKIEKSYGVMDLFNNDNSSKHLQNYKIPNIRYWFNEYAIQELSIIKSMISSLSDADVVNLLKTVLSSIIVSVSYQDSNTRYVRVDKRIRPKDTLKKFRTKTLRTIEKIKRLPYIKMKFRPKVKIADTRKNTRFKENSADLVITSPPYPNAYDYHLYHKHRMYWLDMDPLELKKKEIGSHANYSKKNAFTEKNFIDDMTKAFFEISRVLKKNKYFCIVIGDSILKGKKIKNNVLLKDLSKQTPFRFVFELLRRIQLTKKSFNPKIGNIKNEHIVFFRNNKREK